jgi:replication-associated recombination protein RarA
MGMNKMIMEQLNVFIQEKRIPNIIFHGPHGSGKKTLVREFIQRLYEKKDMETCVMYVNCVVGKGIKFIREDLKFFSKQNIHDTFKSVILLNAEKLTPDAQFALRRCVEQFNHTTRFFIVTTDKYKLIKPILSRFSELYVGSSVNLYTHYNNSRIDTTKLDAEREQLFDSKMKELVPENISEITEWLYTEAYSAQDMIRYVDTHEVGDKDDWMALCASIQYDIYDEKVILYILLHALLFRKELVVKI